MRKIKSKKRRDAVKAGFRSGFEHTISASLKETKVKFEYETETIPYTQVLHRKYKPDFILKIKRKKIYLECKGRLTVFDRMKMLSVKENNPTLDIRFVFQDPNKKINKGSKTRYRDWAEAHNFIWCGPKIPEEWLK